MPPTRASISYEGASADLSRILFTTEPGYRWPFDQTAAGSSTLYEYVGTGNSAPSLVGVSGGAGSTALVSECGTLLGSSTPQQADGSMYNAISASGARVFFTAVGADDQACGGQQPPVDELFAREEVSAGEARTVAISEPLPLLLRGPPAPPCADAHFEGASQDGSEVFFTSAQRLLPEAGEGRPTSTNTTSRPPRVRTWRSFPWAAPPPRAPPRKCRAWRGSARTARTCTSSPGAC